MSETPTQSFPDPVIEWMQARGLTEKAIELGELEWSRPKNSLVIPVKNEKGEIVFNKYRKHPNNKVSAIPKYRYDKGASTTLYNYWRIPQVDFYFFCEGELDALLAYAELGLPAISSTGGSGSFRPEWRKLLEGKEIYLCFDNDEAGLRGMQRIMSELGVGKVCLLPATVGEGGDFTDFIKDGGDPHELMEGAVDMVWSEGDPNDVRYRKQINSEILEKEKELMQNYGRSVTLDVFRKKNEQAIRNLERPATAKTVGDDDIAAAKAVSMEELFGDELKFQYNRAVGLCPLHSEKTPSFTIYQDSNTWWCYGCSRGGDTIDFVMARDDCTFKQALNKIHGKG